MSVQRHFFQPVGKHSSSTHCRETSPAVISGFFIYYAVSYYIKNCLLAFCFLFFFYLIIFFSALFLRPPSRLLVLSLSGRIIRNPLGEAFDLPLIFPNSYTPTQTSGREGSLGTSVYGFPWIGSEVARAMGIFSLAKVPQPFLAWFFTNTNRD